MLQVPSWDKKVEVELDDISKHILRAANYINEHGWCQHLVETPGGAVCLQGALFKTMDPQCMKYRLEWGIAWRTAPSEYLNAEKRVYNYLQHKGMIGNYKGSHNWNDAPGRTKDEVINLLREVAYLGK